MSKKETIQFGISPLVVQITDIAEKENINSLIVIVGGEDDGEKTQFDGLINYQGSTPVNRGVQIVANDISDHTKGVIKITKTRAELKEIITLMSEGMKVASSIAMLGDMTDSAAMRSTGIKKINEGIEILDKIIEEVL